MENRRHDVRHADQQADRILFERTAWKLKSHSDNPLMYNNWDKRDMWLTAGGYFFYFSVERQMPLGHHISGLRLQRLGKMLDYHAFELVDKNSSSPNSRKRIFAFESLQACDECIRCFNNIQFDMARSCYDKFTPFDLFKNSSTPPVAPRSTRNRLRTSEKGTLSERIFPLRQNSSDSIDLRSREQSQNSWASKDRTVLILDWDDTLFPTTWVRDDCALDWKTPLGQQLEPGTKRTCAIKNLLNSHFRRAEEFLDKAATLANVFIVTLAKPNWVDKCCANFTDGIGKVLQKHNIKVIYAQEYLTDAMKEETQQFTCGEQFREFWTRVKREAISKELEHFHNEDQWENILSFGDSEFEISGTIGAGKDYIKKQVKCWKEQSSGASESSLTKKLRIKTMKMLSNPTVEELMAQLTLLTRWLTNLVGKDSSMNLELLNSDNDKLIADLNTKITGRTTELKWSDLCPYL
jgi:hypothetical protein